jgi:hypothetical protein
MVEELVSSVVPLDLRQKGAEIERLRQKVERRGMHA